MERDNENLVEQSHLLENNKNAFICLLIIHLLTLFTSIAFKNARSTVENLICQLTTLSGFVVAILRCNI